VTSHRAAGFFRGRHIARVLEDPDLPGRHKLLALLLGTRPFHVVATRLSHAGERRGIGWLTYNPLLALWYHGKAVGSAAGVARTLERVFPAAQDYADVGAGSGAFAAFAARRGRRVVACEYARVGRWLARLQRVDSRAFNLTRDPPASLGGPFDLAYCFEVAEHVDAQLGSRLVAYLAGLAPTVVFTAAQPRQGGHGHVNEQPKDFWIDAFQQVGMHHRPDLSDEVAAGFRQEGVIYWLVENVLVFERALEGGRGAHRTTCLRDP